ncbi:MAG: AbgT family transporter, partial [Phycisphaerales bacterium]
MSEVPTTTPPPAPRSKRGWFNRFLSVVEWLGNCLPHPVTLFALFALSIVFISGLAAAFGLSVQDPRPLPEGVAPEDHVIT